MDINEEFIDYVESNNLKKVIEMHKKEKLNKRTIRQAGSSACEFGFSRILQYLLENTKYDPSYDNSFDLQQVCDFSPP